MGKGDNGRPTALVTGASSGIGRETAILLAEEGFQVIAAARRMERLEELSGRLNNITEFNEAANQITGDLMARTDPDYRPVYETSGKGIGRMFADVTIPGPDLIARLILEAVTADDPQPAYQAGLFAGEFLEQRKKLDDEGFDQYLSEKTGLKDLKL